jgi:hypothetical protein
MKKTTTTTTTNAIAIATSLFETEKAYGIAISNIQFTPKKSIGISALEMRVADRIAMNENILAAAYEEITLIKSEALKAIEDGANIDNISKALQDAGFTPQRISDLFLKYGLRRKEKDSSQKSKAAAKHAASLVEQVKNGKGITLPNMSKDMAIAVLHRALKQLRADNAASRK